MPAHADLTGSDLHPCKGEAAASANTVRVADGAGSATWQKIDRGQLEKTGNPFGAHLFHLRETSAAGATQQSVGVQTWTKVNLTSTPTNEISSASVSSSQITLPAGTYMIRARVSVSGSVLGRLRFRNISDSSTAIAGLTQGQGTTTFSEPLFVEGRVTIGVTKVFELQIFFYNGGQVGPSGLATFNSTQIGGEDNVLSDVFIYKVA